MIEKLKPILAFLIFALVLSTVHYAISGSTEVNNLIGYGMAPELAGQVDKQYSSNITSSEIPNTNNAVDLGSVSKAFRSIYLGTYAFFASGGGQPVYPLPPIVTPSTTYPTPNATDTLTQKMSLIASTAPTATFVELPRATIQPGNIDKQVYNQAAANPVAIVPISGDAINALAAGTPFACTTGKLCTCRTITGSQWMCTGG